MKNLHPQKEHLFHCKMNLQNNPHFFQTFQPPNINDKKNYHKKAPDCRGLFCLY